MGWMGSLLDEETVVPPKKRKLPLPPMIPQQAEQPAPAPVATQSPVETDSEEALAPPKKPGGSILPVILRMVLPTLAGAAIGSRGSLGGLAGGLGGLASGGLGYSADLTNQANSEYKADKTSRELELKDRTTAASEKQAEAALIRAEKADSGGGASSSKDQLVSTTEEKRLEAVLRSNGGRKFGPADVDKFISYAQTAGIPDLGEYTKSWGGETTFEPNTAAVKQAMDAVNAMVDNPLNVKGSIRNRIGNSGMSAQPAAPAQPSVQTQNSGKTGTVPADKFDAATMEKISDAPNGMIRVRLK